MAAQKPHSSLYGTVGNEVPRFIDEARLAALKTAYATALRIPIAVEKLSPQEIQSSIEAAAKALKTAQLLEHSDDYVIANV